jgi:hypothetical protein
MTTVARGAASTPLLQHKVLLVSKGNVVRTHNHSDTGTAIPIICSLLLDDKVRYAFIAGTNLYDTLAKLNQLMQESVPGWRMRITNRRRYAYVKNERKVVTGRFFVDYFSVDKKVTRNKREPRKRIEVVNLDLITEHPPEDLDEQLEMTLAILEMCEHRGVSFRGTRGGLGNAMLKKSPHWQKGRGPAPRFINDTSRQYLPGNFYSLSNKIREGRKTDGMKHCYYIDQSSAHHNIARQVPIPHPEHLHARGKWKTLEGRWCDRNSPIGQQITNGEQVGLVLARMTIATIGPTMSHLYPPWANKRGTRDVWLWTPELRLLDDHRLQLDCFIASFTTSTSDMVIPEYASWALGELASNEQRAGYKKGSLLAAYGMLAFNGAGKTIYRYWGGENSRPKCEIPLAGEVAESRVAIPPSVQLSTVNVIARGIIESETRTRSIEYARELHTMGFHVPQIYADGILVETDQLPFMPEGWRISHSLTNVFIPRRNAIVSDQIVKLPGNARSEDDRLAEAKREEARMVLPRLTPIERQESLI